MDQKKDIKELFYENPSEDYYLRQIARLTDIPKTTVQRQLKNLVDKKIINRIKKEPFDVYQANTEEPMYRFYKKFHIIEKIYKSGIIERIIEDVMPNVIVLFGSCAKGEYSKDSDIDLYMDVESDIDKLIGGHRINIFSGKLSKLSMELRNNIYNGFVLYGMIDERSHGLRTLQKTPERSRDRSK